MSYFVLTLKLTKTAFYCMLVATCVGYVVMMLLFKEYSSNRRVFHDTRHTPNRLNPSSVFVPPGCLHLQQEFNQNRGFPLLIDSHRLSNCVHRELDSVATKSSCDVFLLIAIKSAPSNRQRRDVIRNTWGNETWIRLELGTVVRTVFLLGVSGQESLNSAIRDESANHGDILQWDFVDAYHNLTVKAVSFFQWFAQNSRPRFVASADDDTFIHMRNVIAHLKATPGAQKFSSGRVVHHVTLKGAASKWGMSDTLYGRDEYPPYPSGGCFLLSADVVVRLHRASQEACLIPVDDLFVGVLLESVAVRPLHDRRFVINNVTNREMNSCTYLTSVLNNFAYLDAGEDVERGSLATVEHFWRIVEGFGRGDVVCN